MTGSRENSLSLRGLQQRIKYFRLLGVSAFVHNQRFTSLLICIGSGGPRLAHRGLLAPSYFIFLPR